MTDLHTALPHQLFCQAQPPMGAHDTQTSDMSMRGIGWLLIHFCQDVAHYSGDGIGVVGIRPPHVNGDIGELWPREGMVEVVFAKVVLRQVGDICCLHVGDVRWSEKADVHGARKPSTGMLCVCVYVCSGVEKPLRT